MNLFLKLERRRLHSRPIHVSQSLAPRVISGGLASVQEYKISPNLSPKQIQIPTSSTNHPRSLSSWIHSNTILVFFPRGYPTSVTPNYFPFMKWHFLGSISGTVTSVLGTQSLLTALGLGSSTGVLPLAATLNWILKDGLGLFGGVIYTALFSNRFDSEPKRYRFLASVAFQTATLLELLTPLFPACFLLFASSSNIAKNIAWLTMSGCRAQMHSSLCLKDNLGDVTAKAGSQSTAAGLLGTGLGVIVSYYVAGSVESALFTFFPLSCLSLWAIYKSNSAVSTNSFNIQRSELLFLQFLKNGKCDTPDVVARKEAFIKIYQSPFGKKLCINSPLKHLKSTSDFYKHIELFQHDNYIIMSQKNQSKCYLWIKSNASSRDSLKAIFHSCVLRSNSSLSGTEIRDHVGRDFPVVYQKLQSNGWNVDEVVVGEHGRIEIKHLF